MDVRPKNSAAALALMIPLCLAALTAVPGPSAQAGGDPEFNVEDVGFVFNSSGEASEPSINAAGEVAGGSIPLSLGGPGKRTKGQGQVLLRQLPRPELMRRGYKPARDGAAISGPSTPYFTAHLTDAALTSVTDLETLGGPSSNAYGLNDTGEVVGYADNASYISRAFRYPLVGEEGKGKRKKKGGPRPSVAHLKDLGPDHVANSYAYDINSESVVVGDAGTPDNEGFEAFRFVDGGKPEFQFLGALHDEPVLSAAYAINDAGVIVGYSQNSAGYARPVVFQPGTATPVLDMGTLGGTTGYARDVNNQGPPLIVGYSSLPAMGCRIEVEPGDAASAQGGILDGATHAFRTSTPGGGMEDLGVLPSFVNSFAYACNDNGVIVGYCDNLSVGCFSTATPVPYTETAFIWRDLNHNGPDAPDMVDLNTLLPPDSGWVLERATDINNAGQIVGIGRYDNVRFNFRLTPIVPPDMTPPSLMNCMIQPASRNALGGDFTLSVVATDAGGIDWVTAQVTNPDMTVEYVGLSRVGMTDTFSGIFTAPQNNTAFDQTYPVTFQAFDEAENENTLACNSFTVLKNAAPVVVICDVDPDGRNAGGGLFTVTATVTDDIGVTQVKARIDGPNPISDVTLTLDSGTATNGVYKGTFTVPANDTAMVQSYYVNICARDGFSAMTDVFCETVTVQQNSPPGIKVCDVTPDALPASGGTFTVSVNVIDDVGVTCVRADITGPNAIAPVTLTLQDGDPTNGTYSGTFDVPANPTETAQLYEVDITVKDGLGGEITEDCETVTVIGLVLDNTPPVIQECAFDPLFLPNQGGNVHVEALVTDDKAVATVKARIERPNGGTDEVLMVAKGGPLYSVDHQVGTAQQPLGAFLDIEIVAQDAAGNTVTEFCGEVRLAGTSEDDPGAVAVTPRLLNFGKVFVGKSVTGEVDVSQLGGSLQSVLAFKHTFTEDPFQVLGAGPTAAHAPSTSSVYLLGKGAHKKIKIKFTPTAAECYLDDLFIYTNDPDQPVILVKLKGIGCIKKKKK